LEWIFTLKIKVNSKLRESRGMRSQKYATRAVIDKSARVLDTKDIGGDDSTPSG